MPTLRGQRRKEFYKSFEARALKSRSILIRFSDDLTSIFSSPLFLVFNALFFASWIALNTGLISSVEPFDPFPFGFLTMVVSLEAIFLSIFVLVSQYRSSYVDTIREELHLQVNLIAEEEITKVLMVLSEIRDKVGIKETDPELEMMLKRIDTNYIEKSLIEQLAKANTPLSRDLIGGMARDFPEIVSATSAPLTKIVDAITPGDLRRGDKDKKKKLQD